MKESGKMGFVITDSKKEKLWETKSFGQNHWGLLIMGKDGRRGEQELKFLAVIFSQPHNGTIFEIQENRAESFAKAILFLSRCTVVKRKKRSMGSG